MRSGAETEFSGGANLRGRGQLSSLAVLASSALVKRHCNLESSN